MKVSCIVPVYNEGERALSVIKVLTEHKLVDEVIVVNDGSIDNTKQILEKIKNINFISLEKNKGKSHALSIGINQAKGEFILLIDSDLIGLNSHNITSLITPVFHGKTDVSISLRKNGDKLNPGFYSRFTNYLYYKKLKFDYISGERMLPASLLKNYLQEIANLPGFGLEVFINKIIIKYQLTIAVVEWGNVKNPCKSEKVGVFQGFRRDSKMIFEMLKVISIWGAIKQNYSLRSLIKASYKGKKFKDKISL